jgi:hypothetical protein
MVLIIFWAEKHNKLAFFVLWILLHHKRTPYSRGEQESWYNAKEFWKLISKSKGMIIQSLILTKKRKVELS